MFINERDIAPTDDQLREIFDSCPNVALIGASPKADRASFRVAEFMLSRGFNLYPVNPGLAGRKILGQSVHADLANLAAEARSVEMVDIFRRSEHVGPIVDMALEYLLPLGLKAIWMQLDIEDIEAAKRAESHGVQVIMNRCPKIEIPRIYGAEGPFRAPLPPKKGRRRR